MHRLLKIAGAALTLTLVSAAGAAQAAVYTINLYGTVSYGFDDLGMFGGGDLAGKAVHGQFTIDTSKGVIDDFSGNPFFPFLGLSGFGPDNPVASQIQVQNGAVHALPEVGMLGSVQRYNSFSDGSFYRVETFKSGGIALDEIVFSHEFSARSPLFDGIPGFSLEPVDFGATAGLGYRARFAAYRGVPGSKSGIEGQPVVSLDYTVDSFSPVAVPEPQIWAMLLIGFGVTGVALQQGRRARAKAALAA